jgi:hypothetical protein
MQKSLIVEEFFFQFVFSKGFIHFLWAFKSNLKRLERNFPHCLIVAQGAIHQLNLCAIELFANDGVDGLLVTEYFTGNEQTGDGLTVFKLLLLPEFAANGKE